MNPILVMIVLYMMAQFGVCVWAGRKIRSETDYLLAGRGLGLGLASFSLFATWFGAETVMGSSAAVAEGGLAGGRADPFGYAICLLLMGLLFAARLRMKEYVTAGDFFRERYSRNVEVLAVWVLLPGSILWTAAQVLAFGQVVAAVSEIPLDTALLAATAVVIAYTVVGGLLGDVINDAIEGGVMIAGLAVLLGYVIAHAGGISAAIDSIRPEQLSFIAEGESAAARMDAWLIPVLGSLVAQEALARLLATKSPAVARKAAFAGSALYLIVGCIPVLIALVAANFDLALDHRDEFLPELAEKLLPAPLFILLVGAIASAILSTINSTLITFSSLVTHNLVFPRLPALPEKKKVLIIRGGVALGGVLSYIAAAAGDTIFELVELASSLGTPGVIVTFLGGMAWKRAGPKAAAATLATGIALGFLGEPLFEWEAPFASTLAVCAGVYAAGALLGKPRAAQWT